MIRTCGCGRHDLLPAVLVPRRALDSWYGMIFLRHAFPKSRLPYRSSLCFQRRSESNTHPLVFECSTGGCCCTYLCHVLSGFPSFSTFIDSFRQRTVPCDAKLMTWFMYVRTIACAVLHGLFLTCFQFGLSASSF